MDQIIVESSASGEVLAFTEGISFWGGVNAQSGVVQDAHHPHFGQSVAGKLVMMPTSRGSCSGSGVLLELALNGHAPAALIFHETEDILTLGAVIAARMFDKALAVVSLSKDSYALLARQRQAQIEGDRIIAGDLRLDLQPLQTDSLQLSLPDTEMLHGAKGEATQLAMEVIHIMGAVQGATRLIDVTRVHIDGCIYAGPANLTFAKAVEKSGARVRVPTTMNAISVDFNNWRNQGVPLEFGTAAERLASAYVSMGASPTFTCAPYLADDRPMQGEDIGWSESNAVIYANSVLGARTVKHPDFFDLFVAVTGRAPLSGVYLQENRQALIEILVELPDQYDDAIWPLIGWVTGQQSPDRIPKLQGLDLAGIGEDDLKAICAAFGTTSAAPMLHIQGVTPEGDAESFPDAEQSTITKETLAIAWKQLNQGPERVDLVALGSPHFSLSETRRFTQLMSGRRCAETTNTIITLGRDTFTQAHAMGLIAELESSGIRIVQDLCWCSISEPVFPPEARHLVTNSGKYAHYAPGLSGRTVRFASLVHCAQAAVEGSLAKELPSWLK